MKIEIRPTKILYDGTTSSVRIGFRFDGKLYSIRVSEEYIQDKFTLSAASPDEMVSLVKTDFQSIEIIVIAKSNAGIPPDQIVVSTTDL